MTGQSSEDYAKVFSNLASVGVSPNEALSNLSETFRLVSNSTNLASNFNEISERLNYPLGSSERHSRLIEVVSSCSFIDDYCLDTIIELRLFTVWKEPNQAFKIGNSESCDICDFHRGTLKPIVKVQGNYSPVGQLGSTYNPLMVCKHRCLEAMLKPLSK